MDETHWTQRVFRGECLPAMCCIARMLWLRSFLYRQTARALEKKTSLTHRNTQNTRARRNRTGAQF